MAVIYVISWFLLLRVIHENLTGLLVGLELQVVANAFFVMQDHIAEWISNGRSATNTCTMYMSCMCTACVAHNLMTTRSASCPLRDTRRFVREAQLDPTFIPRFKN